MRLPYNGIIKTEFKNRDKECKTDTSCVQAQQAEPLYNKYNTWSLETLSNGKLHPVEECYILTIESSFFLFWFTNDLAESFCMTSQINEYIITFFSYLVQTDCVDASVAKSKSMADSLVKIALSLPVHKQIEHS